MNTQGKGLSDRSTATMIGVLFIVGILLTLLGLLWKRPTRSP